MKILFAAPLLLLGACNVDRDSSNGTTTVSFNEDVAQNTLSDVGDVAENLGGAIANEADQTADKVKNEVGDVDVDVNVSRDKDHDGNHQYDGSAGCSPRRTRVAGAPSGSSAAW